MNKKKYKKIKGRGFRGRSIWIIETWQGYRVATCSSEYFANKVLKALVNYKE